MSCRSTFNSETGSSETGSSETGSSETGSSETGSSETGCENTYCTDCCYDKTKLFVYHSALQPLQNNKTTQGIVYRCKIKPIIDKKQTQVIKTIVKTSRQVDFVLENEVEAWKRLSIFKSPHFTEIIKHLPVLKHESRLAVFFEEVNTGIENGKHVTNAQFYTQKSKSFQNKCISLTGLLKCSDKHPSAVLNCVRQTLAAVIMYESVGITHYDLHSDNIMIKNTPYDIHVYKFDDNIIPIMTFGITPVVIDFGLSHINNHAWAATNCFLHQGLSTFLKDPIIDCILLLTTIKTHMSFHSAWITKNYISEMKNYYKFVKLVTTWFQNINVDKNGWFVQNHFPDLIYDLLQAFPEIKYGIFSTKNIAWVIETIQYTITVPITVYKRVDVSFRQSLLQLSILWIETVELLIKNFNKEKLLLKDLVLFVANKNNVSDIIKLKKRYPCIKNFFQLINAIQLVSDAYSNKIFKISNKIKEIKTDLYSKVPKYTTMDFLKSIPYVNYEVKPGMTVLIQDVKNVKQYTFIVNKKIASEINHDSSRLLNIINSMCKNNEICIK